MKYLTALTAMALSATMAAAEYTTEYVGLDHQSAVVYKPAEQTSGIGVVVMHSDMDYLDFIANSELSERGHVVMATIPPSTQDLGEKMVYIKNCINYLRSLEDINKVVLLGHSGGATVMTAYQLIAENGRDVLNNKMYDGYSSDIDSLPPADGLLLLDANYGLSTMTLISLDPNVTEQDRGTRVSEKLNPGDPAVGYNPDGSSHYTSDFVAKYNSAQARRLNTLTELADIGVRNVDNGNGNFTGDEPFIVAGAELMRFYNKLILQDTGLLAHTVGKWTLLKPDGATATQQIECVRRPMKYMDCTPQYADAIVTTVKGWMSSYAIKVSDLFRITADKIEGVDWTSNINTPIGNITGIRIPSLFMGMTGSYEYLASESIYNNSPAVDKTVVFCEGASHMLTPDQPKYDGITTAIFNYVDNWLRSRFSK